jgi:DNA polymerase-3 subunit alpha
VRADENNQMAMTQYAMDPIAKLGLLKMDVLGLTNLTILDRTIKVIQKRRGQRIDLHSIPLDDDRTFKLLSSGHTTDLFQLESAGMQRHIKELQPSSLSDVAAMIALYRPGPMEQIDRFIKSKHGLEPPRYPHPALEEILRDTYGVIVYQDQVLFILQSFAGYSLGQADIVRKAMGKKNPQLMRKERERFIQGAVANGFSHSLAREVFDLIEPFAGYAFNKAHSVSYALIAYWTAYFKANYAPEYMCSVLNSRLGNTERAVSAISECFRIGLKVLGPDVNHSDAHFTLEQDVTGATALRFGLAGVKNVGETVMRPIIAARQQGGLFSTIEDFCSRVGQSLNRRTLESLIKVGAFDSLGDRSALVASVDKVIATAQREARRRQSGQVSMFEAAGGALTQLEKIPVEGETSLSEKGLWENEFLGVAFSLSGLALNAPPEVVYSLDQLVDMPDNQQVKVRGLVISVAERLNREQRSFFSVTLLLLGGKLEVLVWPGFLEKTRDLWQEGVLLEIVGKKRSRGSEISLHCDSAEPFQSASNGQKSQKGMTEESKLLNKHTSPVSRTLHVRLRESESQEEDRMCLQELIRMLLEFPGQDRIYLEIATGGKTVRMEMPTLLTTGFCPELERRLNSLLGAGSFRLEEGSLNTAK